MHTIHLRINDAATGKPTPVRLSITERDGTYYAPLGRLTEFATGRHEDVGGHLRLGRDKYCYIDGSCEVKLPAGVPLRIRASKGPEYRPLNEVVTLGAGKMALRFELERVANLREQGWYAGDTRVHTLSPHAALLEASAEDVAIANLLAKVQDWPSLDGTLYPSIPNITAFSGQSPLLQTDAALVAVNTLNVHPVLGSVAMLHSHRVVHPLTFGGADTSDDWSVCDWCDQCHRKNGLTVWTNPFDPHGGEALVALILGKIDAIELSGASRKSPLFLWWYRLLNAGFRVPLVGASGKDSNTVALGAMRTYAKLLPDELLTYTNWINAVRAGRCYATAGRLLTFDVNGAGPGRVIELPEGEHCLLVRASDRVAVIVNGEPVASGRNVEQELSISESCWIAARSRTGEPTHFGHTSPVYVNVAGRPLAKRAEALPHLRRLVEATREWVELHGRFVEDRSKRHLLELCDAALARLAP